MILNDKSSRQPVQTSDSIVNSSAKRTKKRDKVRLHIPNGFFVRWYAAHGRTFPWRDAGVNPFAILVAEVLLKQTRAEMVARVWPSLVRKYPGPEELATADREELFGMIAGLGFGHQRTTALLDVASTVKRNGVLPSQPEELLKLPYIGLYSAHAVACFGFAQPVPVVDLNVVRVFSRIADINPPKDIRRAPDIWSIAWALLPRSSFQEHNYGLLDFAATVCKPRSPRCSQCPIATRCAHVYAS